MPLKLLQKEQFKKQLRQLMICLLIKSPRKLQKSQKPHQISSEAVRNETEKM